MSVYPKISIVTPSYNQGQYIEQTILSIINQNYPNLEYIIIDGGSTDNTVDIIKKYEHYLSYWISEPDKGQSDALNKGLAKCTGDIFNWINSDDYLEENAFVKVADYFIKNPTTDMLCGFCRLFEEETLKEIFKHRTQIFTALEETLAEQQINQPASFYKLSIIKSLGGLNTGLQYVMDLDLWFRYLCQYGQKNILLIDDLLAHFRVHKNSKTKSLQGKFREEEKMLWSYLLQKLNIKNSLISYFKSNKSYPNFKDWDCTSINRKRLINTLCKKHLLEFYKAKDKSAAKFAFINQLSNGLLPLKRYTAGMFYNLFLKGQ